VTLYGGVMAILPAYIADIFGPKYVSAYLGRMLTGSSLCSFNCLYCIVFIIIIGYLFGFAFASASLSPAAWSAAALTGTAILTFMRGRSYTAAAEQLAGLCDPQVFFETFGMLPENRCFSPFSSFSFWLSSSLIYLFPV
jgi:hypothetical protein